MVANRMLQDADLVTLEQLQLQVRAPMSSMRVSGQERINVTYIVGSLRAAGAERRTLELLKHLDRDRFAPSLILMERSGAEQARELTEQIFVMGIPEGGNSQWWKRGPSLAVAVGKTRGQLIRWRSQVVHAMLPGASIIGGLAARLAGVPLSIGSRPCMTSLYRSGRGVLAQVDRLALRLAHVNLANSRAVSHEMVTLGGCPPEKCHTIHNGVDTRRFHPDLSQSWRAAMGWSEQHVVLGLVANFYPYKRHTDFVHAASLIAPCHPEARFVMVGADCGSRGEVMRQVFDRGLGDKVRILDSDPYPEKILAALDISVCTSQSEGFSNVILESMACGKPVIATNVGGNPEAVLDRLTGLLVPWGAPETLAAVAAQLIRDPEQRRIMGMRGHQRIEREFSLERMVCQYQDLYLQLLLERRKHKA
jgi:glycosyltransferase involved in cell wall biosynthesis